MLSIPEKIKHKILNEETLSRQLHIWKLQDKKIVFTNGCFDILHPGHIDYLSKASGLGGILIVGLNSDRSVKNIKGPTRPIFDETSRIILLASLSFVNAVIIFDAPTPYELIKFIKPQFLVKGADYTPEEISGSDIVTSSGGKVITFDLVPGFSTSMIEKKIVSNR